MAPNVNRFEPHTFRNLSPGSLRLWGAWESDWSYSLNGQPSDGYLALGFDGATFYSEHLVTADWTSQFLLETAWSSVTVYAWVRGTPGTTVEVATSHIGGGSASRLNYGGGVTAGGSTSGFPNATAGSFTHNTSSGGYEMLTTSGVTRTFPEYPGVIYSRLDFGPMSVGMQGGQSCIMLCPGSFINGQVHLLSNLTVRLPTGLRPKVVAVFPVPRSVVGDYPVASDNTFVYVPHSTSLELRVLAFDPDDGSKAHAGIVGYRWARDGSALGGGLGSLCARAVVLTELRPGETQVWTVAAIDNEGFVSDPKTIRLRALPVLQLPWPGSGPGPEQVPLLVGSGSLGAGSFSLLLTNAAPMVPGLMVLGALTPPLPMLGGNVYSTADVLLPIVTNAVGEWSLPVVPALPSPLMLQSWTWSGSGTDWSSSNGFLAL
ncbi:MAG TPA: hypothetical protein ENI87_05780 [bacterium]|nr:hypothetical protein [bacterium]